jgi:Protein of unknown function (DUF2971)
MLAAQPWMESALQASGNHVRERELTVNPNRRHDRQLFYKYTTASTAKAILANRTLRWSSPLIFNDPFEVPRNLSFDCSARELQEALAEELAVMIETGAPTPPNAPPMLGFLLDALRNNPNPAYRAFISNDLRVNALKDIPEPKVGFRAFQEFWDQSIPTMRILCVSENAISTAMWAHYADSHTGATLEFEALDAVDSPLLAVRPVRYQDEPPKLPSKCEWVESMMGRKPIKMEDFFTDYQYMKSTQWEYEREWRIVSYARAGESGLFADYNFSAEELRRIILGANCSVEHEAQIRAIVTATYPNASVVHASINHELRQIDF